MPTLQNLCTLGIVLLPLVTGVKLNLFKHPDQEGHLRLSGSGRASEGRLEVFHRGRWGTVCDDGWNMAAARVVCRQLGFPGAKSVVDGKDYGGEPGPIWLDDITCNGLENNLFNCALKAWGQTDCTHKEDVGIICQTDSPESAMADSTHFLDHSLSLSEDLGRIFDSEIGCDFLIFVNSVSGNMEGTPGAMETTICAHKIILSLFPVFNAADNSNMTLEVSPSCHPHVPSFIRYMYTRRVDVTTSSVQCLHWMASRFGIMQLVRGTVRLFSRVLPEDSTFNTQLSIYSYALETEDLVLQENCLQYLAWNFKNLTRSPAWPKVSAELLKAILVRSDLVVTNEYSLMETLESWIVNRANATSFETQADLLKQIRFPMIPVEDLYTLQFNSSLYSAHMKLYQDGMMKAFQFNIYRIRKLASNPNFMVDDDDYKPRLYTAWLWSTVLGSGSGSGKAASRPFSSPLHFSNIYQSQSVRWQATLFKNQLECSNRGLRCKSLPMIQLLPNQNYDEIVFRNRLVLTCQGQYVSQVQDFKENLAYMPNNRTLVFPCPDDQLTYRLIVRPEYKFP